jgi:hypothetical protein
MRSATEPQPASALGQPLTLVVYESAGLLGDLIVVVEMTTLYYYRAILNYLKYWKSSSKAQIAAYLLMILAMAERGGLKPPLLSGR